MSPRNPTSAYTTIFALALALATVVNARNHDFPPPADPYLDPKDDPYNPLGYITSNSLSGVGVGLTLAVALGQTFLSVKHRTGFMLAMVIAAYTYALGIAVRFGLHAHPESSGLYIVMYLFITLSPCGFIAAEYVLLGRLARWLHGDRHMLIRPQRITLVFVLSDVTTFLVQAAGGSISASAHTDISKAQAGSRIFLAGIALQFLSFLCFTLLYLRFLYRMRKYEHEVWVKDALEGKAWYRDWRALAAAMFVSCIGVLVRSVYRTVELSEGFDGYLTRTEVFFYVLDFVPLIVALTVYLPFWPGRFIPKNLPGVFAADAEAAATPDLKQSADDGTLEDRHTPEAKPE